MIVDWGTMNPHVCGDAVDFIGRELPKDTVRVNVLTGEVWSHARYSDGSLVLNAERTEIVEIMQQFVPPITVWLYL